VTQGFGRTLTAITVITTTFTQLPVATQSRAVVGEVRGKASGSSGRVINDQGKTTIELTDPSGGRQTVELSNYLPRVAESRFIDDDKGLVLIGDEGPAQALVLIDAKRGKLLTNLETLGVSLSPNTRFAVFRPFVPGKDSTDYILLPLTTRPPASASRFYPSDSSQHVLRSRLQWVKDDTLAFLDMARNQTNLVVVRFAENGSVGRLVEKKLDAGALVDASKVEGGTPEIAIAGASISQLDGPGMTLRLIFGPQVSLKVRRVDVRVW
jgi:hypothetical protein